MARSAPGTPRPPGTPRAEVPQLYEHPLSFACQVARLCLVEKGLRWRRRRLDPLFGLDLYDPWFLALSSDLALPVLRHGTRCPAGVEAVCRYVDGAFAGPLLDHRDEARPWIDLVQALPLELLGYARFPRLGHWHLKRRYRRLEDRAAANPALAARYAEEGEAVARLARDLTRPERVGAAERQLEVTLDRAEAALVHRPFLTGAQINLADLFWAALLARLEGLGYAGLWRDGARPAVAAYWARLRARPSLAKAGVRPRPGTFALLGLGLRGAWAALLRLLLAALLAGLGVWLWMRLGAPGL